MEICPVETVLIHADRWTDMKKLIGACHDYANALIKHPQMPVNFTNEWFSYN
jgi:hypothetical protein